MRGSSAGQGEANLKGTTSVVSSAGAGEGVGVGLGAGSGAGSGAGEEQDREAILRRMTVNIVINAVNRFILTSSLSFYERGARPADKRLLAGK